MSRTPILALLCLSAACAPHGSGSPATPDPYPRPVGVLVSKNRGRCTHVVLGDRVQRVCVPRVGGTPTERDTVPADTSRSRVR